MSKTDLIISLGAILTVSWFILKCKGEIIYSFGDEYNNKLKFKKKHQRFSMTVSNENLNQSNNDNGDNNNDN